MMLVAFAAQIAVALAVSLVLMIGLGLHHPPPSRMVSLLVMALGVGGAVSLVGQLLDRGAAWRSATGAIAGAMVGYALVVFKAPQKLMELLPDVDSIHLFALCAAVPAVAGYWLGRGR